MADDEKGNGPPERKPGRGEDPGDGKDGKDQAKGRQDKGQGEQKAEADKAPPKPRRIWPWVLGGVVVLGFVLAVLAIIFAPAPDVWTDDAYVTAHSATVAPRISGQVASVAVDDNQVVSAGQPLVLLDDRDFRAALASAEAMLERDKARLDEAAASLDRQPALVRQAQTQGPSSAAQLTLAQANQRRYRNLAATGAGTQQERQQADEQVQASQAAVEQAQAGTEAARRQIPVLEAQRAAAEAVVRTDQAQVEQARLNLSYTRILAPIDGVIGQRTVQNGNYVAPGAPLLSVVPLDHIYIEANYRELALRHMRPGQPVTIHVDAYDIDLRGVVDSLPPASGAAFGAIQPNNATGNFTKIVQRLPVKILVSPGQDEARLLRIGFSVETTVHTGLADVVARQRGNPSSVTAP